MKLLIVEDSPSERHNFKKCVESLSELDIQPEFAETFEEALEKFQEFDPDCIFIDIKLQSGTKGNDLFEYISRYRSSKIIRIITSHKGEIEPEINTLVNEYFFKIYGRTDKEFVEIIKEVYKIFVHPAYSLVNRDKEINEEVRNIYYSHIDHLIKIGEFKAGTNKTRIFRYLGAMLYESFSVNENSLDNFYPWEMFFCPPILDFIYNGDIIKKKANEKYFIVLSPRCDLTPRGGGTTNVDECLIAELEVVKLIDYIDKESKKFTGSGIEIIKNKKNHTHFIPEIDKNGPFNINFLKLHRIKKEEIDQNYDRIACITPAFMKEIVHRFSSYYSRQGQPDLDIDHLFNKYSKT